MRFIHIVTRAHKRPVETARHSQSATLHSTGNISVEGIVYKNKQHTWSSKIVVIFPAESTAAHSLHFQHLYVD
jgi:hypothetical protein